MVGYTKAKTQNFSVLQTNAYSYKALRILQMLTTDTISFSLSVIALHANNLRIFLTNVVIAGAVCLSAFLIFASFTKIASGFLCLCFLVFGCSSPFSVALRLNARLLWIDKGLDIPASSFPKRIKNFLLFLLKIWLFSPCNC